MQVDNLSKSHPGPINKIGKVCKEDTQWHHIGSGIMARTFKDAKRMMTTTAGGPQMQNIHRRVVRSLTIVKVLDDCIVDDVPDQRLHRHLAKEDNIRVELTMKGAMQMFEVKGPDVCEI